MAAINDTNGNGLPSAFSVPQISRLLNVSPRTLYDRIAASDLLPDGKRGQASLYALPKVIPLILDRFACGDKIDPDTLPPLARKHWLEGETIVRKLAVDAKELITVDEYVDALAPVLKLYGQQLETLPDVLQRKCALNPKTVIALQKMVDEWRENIAKDFEKLCKRDE